MAGTETAASLIYLDVDDEITSAAARIRAADGERLALVLPYGSRLATSRINFRLLAREAAERGKKIEIVCADPSTRALATAAGMPVHPSVSAFETATDGPGEPSGGEPTGGNGAEGPGGARVAGVAGTPVGGLDIEDETQTRVLTLPRKSPARVPRVGPPRPPVRTSLAVGIGLVVVVLVLVGGFLALELLPSATVVLAPRSEVIGPISLTIEARADVTAPDPATLTVPAQRVTFDLEATSTVTATGVRVIEEQATGNVMFSNYDPFGSNHIEAGAVVRTKSGIEFAILAEVTLPKAGIDFSDPLAPVIIPSTSTVGIEAVVAGPDSNVNNNTITVVPEGENKSATKVTNPEATLGGASGEVPEISQADVDAGLLAIDAALVDELGRQVAEGIGVPPGVDVFDQTQAVGEPEFATDPQSLVGSASLEVELVATAEGSILGVDPAPIDAMAEARLAQYVTSGWSLAPGSTAFGLAPPTVFGEIVTYPVTIQATQVRDVDEAALAEQIRGLLLAEARSRLDDYGDVEITLWPDWVTSLPKNAERITVTLGDPRPTQSPPP